MTLEQIQEQADALFQELNQLKAVEEIQDHFNESFRATCINKLNNFFQKASRINTGVQYHIVGVNKGNTYKKSIVVFDKAPSPIDVELVCTHEHIHIPNWFKQVCEKYLGIHFSQTNNDTAYYEYYWVIKEVQELKSLMKNYQSDNDDIYQVLERYIFSSQKMNLFGEDMKSQFADIELKGLLMILLEDFELYGWDISSNIGTDNNDPRFLKVYIEKKIYINVLEVLNELLEKQNLAKVYEIIRNSIHKANQEYLGAIIIGEKPKVHWNFTDVY
ncbi:hypothetical protein [Crocinitomix algicola]|uniref:hypothetical protein n=1 Tax=Crocinitomix algicola TaxID=1740263 RepID=UPI000872CDB8|nr:hypothetical protein [Crocinitomix algicola]